MNFKSKGGRGRKVIVVFGCRLSLLLLCNVVMTKATFPPPPLPFTHPKRTVSRTTSDLVFSWDERMPVDIAKEIRFPQLELTTTRTGNCTTEYTSGKRSNTVQLEILNQGQVWR